MMLALCRDEGAGDAGKCDGICLIEIAQGVWGESQRGQSELPGEVQACFLNQVASKERPERHIGIIQSKKSTGKGTSQVEGVWKVKS